MAKALGLLSGGLDSTLAALCLRRQGIEVTAIAFVTPFFGSARAEKAAAALDLPLIIEEIGPAHLEVVKHPLYGYGRNLNPCIDCHAMMFRQAGRRMESDGYDFIFSGEVLAQRPMSQNLSALQVVARHSGYPQRILRPLSARLLPPTVMETSGLVDRERLLDIKGRTRRRQQELAEAWGVIDYPGSGGGCLLTENSFSGRLRDLLTYQPECTTHDVEVLKLGRQFRLSPRAKLVLGRDEADNQRLRDLFRPGDLRLRSRDYTGPLGLLTGAHTEVDLHMAAAIVATYGKGREEPLVTVIVESSGDAAGLQVVPATKEVIQSCQIAS